MNFPVIPTSTLIPDSAIPGDEKFGLKIVRFQSDKKAQEEFLGSRYEFQHEIGRRHKVPGVVLALKGAPPNYRITATIHPTLREFVEIVKYNPANPPGDNYDAIGMATAHEQTQSDFKGAKKENLAHFRNYNIEAISGERTAYLPTVSGWQSSAVFDQTIFVAYDETNEMSLYGILYLPKAPVMQSDGQTQTAALFQAAETGLAIKAGALDHFGTTLEIELNVDEIKAGQSFADRNGRGSKKNKNLVSRLDNSSALAIIRERSVKGTIFEGRLADGRTGGASETATKHIVDLSTMDQMLLNVICKGNKKPEQIKHHHVERFVPYCHEFLLLLQETCGPQWPDPTPKNHEPYRRLYIHGWAFAQKALALAYHEAMRHKIEPLGAGLGLATDHSTPNEQIEADRELVEAAKADAPSPALPLEELKDRLNKIDWVRYRKHWIAVTGHKIDKEGNKKTREIKDGTEGGRKLILEGQAQNTAATIGFVLNKILSSTWTDLCSNVDAKI
ncbi:hypothetical protein [Streptomyces phaeochromogenes]|uniref:hypothetical protein n=1 Tax=Streptomyces phaeochromogenes TaxID=1923 RepID=UPI00371C5606